MDMKNAKRALGKVALTPYSFRDRHSSMSARFSFTPRRKAAVTIAAAGLVRERRAGAVQTLRAMLRPERPLYGVTSF